MMTPARQAALAAMRLLSGGEKLFRPSSTTRNVECPGSVIAGLRAPKDKGSAAAREGTAAHLLAQRHFEGRLRVENMGDRFVKLDDGGPDIYVDEAMVEYVQGYIDYCDTNWSTSAKRYIEAKLSLGLLDPTDPLLAENAGTADYLEVDFPQRILKITDLKYGKGVMVKGDSPQLKNYALMGMLAHNPPDGRGWKTIRTTVYQPRAFSEVERIKVVDHDPNDLMFEFAAQLVEAMERALDPDAPLKPGDHCTFCRAAATCPALREQAVHIARDAFTRTPLMSASTDLAPLPAQVIQGGPDTPRPAEVAGAVVLPSPVRLTVDEIATILERETLWDTWISAVKHHAATLIQSGVTIPGWRMVARSGNRRWKDGLDVPSELAKLGLTSDRIYVEPKLKSPTQVEKILKGAQKDMMLSLVERPTGAPTLVRAEDARPSVSALMGPIPEENR